MEKVTIKKLTAKILIGLTFFLIAGFLLKGPLAKVIFVQAVQKITGVSIRLKELHLALFKGSVKIKGLQLRNPKDFPPQERTLAYIPELYIDLEPMALLRGKIHLETVSLTLQELIILRNAEGKLNLSSLKPVQEESVEKKKSEGKPGKEMNFQLDYLRLSIGKVYYRDYRSGDSPPSREYTIEIEGAEYRNIQDSGELVRQILAQALTRTAFAELGDLEEIQRRIEKNLQKAKESFKKETQKVLQETAEALDALQLFKSPPESSQTESEK